MAFPTFEHTISIDQRRALFLSLACAVVLFLFFSGAAQALREFPANTQRGVLESHQYPYYKIGNTTYRIAAGGKIFDEHNRIVMPVSLRAQKAEVMFRVDMNGDLSMLWLLTAAEAKRFPRPAAPKPAPPGKP